MGGQAEEASSPVRRVEIRAAKYDSAEVQALLREIQGEYLRRYGGNDETRVDAAEFAPPRGRFLLGFLDGDPVAIGGWRWRRDVSALGGTRAVEVKRMYVAPRARRTGLARAVLARLEASARAAGADVMILESGLPQPEAVALYRSSGYTDTVRFGIYADEAHSVYLGKRLDES